MSDIERKTRLIVEAMPDGGYLVTAPPRHPNEEAAARFACSDLDDALGYIKSRMEPPGTIIREYERRIQTAKAELERRAAK